jgi:hypothetical protein
MDMLSRELRYEVIEKMHLPHAAAAARSCWIFIFQPVLHTLSQMIL